ncbi:MAG: SDR family NAD(P)-dependent oxidoreductase, partial [Moraxella osloensis]|nr:SDR family NAD(P)-dependent oxidoreductase [Moraxella osloensis]
MGQMLTLAQFKGMRVWLVGGSEGIGFALAEQLLAAGARVLVSARQAQSHNGLIRLQSQYAQHLQLLNVDVMQTQELAEKVHQAWWVFSGLDVWIYNAGAYQPMTLDQWDLHAFEQMNGINYLGAVHLMHHLLPLFRQSGA